MMKTVVTHSAPQGPPKAQRITNMERLAPGFAEAVVEWSEEERLADKITLVLARDQGAFSDYCRTRQVQAGHRVRRIMGVRDLQGYAPDSVEIIALPDWQQSMPAYELERVQQMLAAVTLPSIAIPGLVDVPWIPPESGPLAGRNAAGRKVPPQSSSSTSMTRSSVITVDASTGLSRVRMGRTKERKGDVGGYPLDVVTTQYLDGKALRVAATKQYFQEDEVAFDAVPARTKDITDFGRLTTAAKSLAVSMAAFGPDNEPSSEQLAVFIAGYRNLLEWRRKVRQQMTRAEGEIDAVETLLTQIL